MSQPTSCPTSPMMSPFPALSMFPPQLLGDLLDVLQGLLHCGEAPAAARLIFAAFPSSLPLPPNHICPLNFPPPQSSPRKRRRRRRKRKASPASSSNSTQSPSRLLETSTSTAIDGKLTPQQFREFDITSISSTINRLAPGNCYMPINSASTSPLSQIALRSPPASFKQAKGVIAKAKEAVIIGQDEEQMSNKLVGDKVSLQQAEVEEAIAHEVDQLITYKEKEVLVKQPEDVFIMRAEVEVINREVDEEAVTTEADEEVLVNQVEEFRMSVEGFQYDEKTGQVSYQDETVEFASPQLRKQLLAKMFPAPVLSSGSSFTSPPALPDGPLPSLSCPKPLNLRHRDRRLTFAHLNPAKVRSLGRRTSWTKALLMSDLAAAFSKPRLGISWSDFSPEEKLAHFGMVDWAASHPDDPPSRALMVEPDEDPWSTWA